MAFAAEHVLQQQTDIRVVFYEEDASHPDFRRTGGRGELRGGIPNVPKQEAHGM